jgi:integral membrane protein (TIGR01906 family)
MDTLRGTLATIVVGIAAALVIVAIAILPFLNPVWLGFEQGRAQAAAWTGFTEADLRTATDAILVDLIVGPPEFDVALDGVAVLNERERGHMRDVRGVFGAFYGLALVAAAVLVGAFLVARDRAARARLWRRLSLAGRVIAVATVALGIVGVLFFDTAFEVFHELFFPAGSFLFDPTTDRLVQLFPESFWVESTIGVGMVTILLAAGLTWLGTRRARTLEASVAATAGAGLAAPVAEGGRG